MYFNTTSSSFEQTVAINSDVPFYINYYKNYNTTLLYIWGGEQLKSSFNSIILYNTVTQIWTQFSVTNQIFSYLRIRNNNLFAIFMEEDSGSYTILKTNMEFYSISSWSPFQNSTKYSFNTVVQNQQLENINMNNLTIILTDKYILVFDEFQTHYSVYDEFISNIFWPQTKYFGNTTI